MKSAPEGLPPASSAAWHDRRWWDPLGHLRVRSRENPRWRRDVPWLVRWLQHENPPAADPLRPLYDRAVAAARNDQHLLDRSGADVDAAWDTGVSGQDATPKAPVDALP